MSFPQPKPQVPQLPRHLLRTIQCNQGAVRAVRFNADGNYLLSCGSDKSLKLSYDNSQLCSCSSDKTVILWDVATGQVARKLRGHAGKVNCVQFNEEATVILSGSIDGTVRCWDTRSRRFEPIQVLDEARDGISSLKVSQHELLTGKDTHVLSCSEDGHVYCWDLVEGSLTLKLPVGKAVVQSLSFHPTETRLLTAMEGRVQVWGAEPEETEGEGEEEEEKA
ncbi:hypothetical protein CRUP_030151 [Coryphaenoides rupestris]|nr:hypothetical protein CRUP_030151 [Coryphaenoides rupestris]